MWTSETQDKWNTWRLSTWRWYKGKENRWSEYEAGQNWGANSVVYLYQVQASENFIGATKGKRILSRNV